MKSIIMPIKMTFALFLTGISISCMNTDKTPEQTKEIRYMPLGDSYTVGTGATEGNSWPEVLTRHMVDSGFNFRMLENPAHNGYTCKDLIEDELPVFFREKPDFVTLCIGTNDWNVGYDSSHFRYNLRYILDTIQATLTVKTNIVVLTLPDFGLTKGAAIYAQGRNVSAALASFNVIIEQEAKARGLQCVDIFAVSQDVKNDPSLISSDNLHPSDKGYAEWEKAIFPVVTKLLSNQKVQR